MWRLWRTNIILLLYIMSYRYPINWVSSSLYFLYERIQHVCVKASYSRAYTFLWRLCNNLVNIRWIYTAILLLVILYDVTKIHNIVYILIWISIDFTDNICNGANVIRLSIPLHTILFKHDKWNIDICQSRWRVKQWPHRYDMFSIY